MRAGSIRPNPGVARTPTSPNRAWSNKRAHVQAAWVRVGSQILAGLGPEMKQNVTDHEGEVIEQKAGCVMQRTHNGPLFPTRLAASAHGRSDPDSRPGRACATCGSSLKPRPV